MVDAYACFQVGIKHVEIRHTKRLLSIVEPVENQMKSLNDFIRVIHVATNFKSRQI